MEQNDIPGPAPPAERRKRPLWAWLAVGGGLTLVAILTATAVELGQRPLTAPPNQGTEAVPAASPPPDMGLLATVPATPAPSDPIVSPQPEPAPPPRATEAPPPRVLDPTSPRSARVPMRAVPVQPAAPATSGGRDG